jgi:hypothetical protein
MTLRRVAGDIERFSARARLSEPTGSPLAMWRRIRDFNTSFARSSIVGVVIVAA